MKTQNVKTKLKLNQNYIEGQNEQKLKLKHLSFSFENPSFIYSLEVIELSPPMAHFYFLSEISSNCYGHG